ncbi:MAG: hypothetical protein ACRBBJ_09435 [Rhodomicrobiaceae bacterium]
MHHYTTTNNGCDMPYLTNIFKMSLMLAVLAGIAGTLGACNNSPSHGGYDIPIEKERRGSH